MAQFLVLLLTLTVLGLAAAFAPGGATLLHTGRHAASASRTTQIVLGRKGRPNMPASGMQQQARTFSSTHASRAPILVDFDGSTAWGVVLGPGHLGVDTH